MILIIEILGYVVQKKLSALGKMQLLNAAFSVQFFTNLQHVFYQNRKSLISGE
jgi:hypothetical protein